MRSGAGCPDSSPSDAAARQVEPEAVSGGYRRGESFGAASESHAAIRPGSAPPRRGEARRDRCSRSFPGRRARPRRRRRRRSSPRPAPPPAMSAPPSPSRRTRRSLPIRFATQSSRPLPVSNASACTSRGTETSVARRVRPEAPYIPRITCQAGNRPPCSSNQGCGASPGWWTRPWSPVGAPRISDSTPPSAALAATPRCQAAPSRPRWRGSLRHMATRPPCGFGAGGPPKGLVRVPIPTGPRQ